MKKIYSLIIFVCFVFVGLAQAMIIDYKKEKWSQTANDLRGRLIVEARPKINNSTIIGVALELQNVSDHPIKVFNDPELTDAELFGPEGKPILPRRDLPMDGMTLPPEQKMLLPGQSIKFAIESHSAGVPQSVIFLDLYAHKDVDKVWTPNPALRGSEYFLRGIFQQIESDKNCPECWVGSIHLPFVKIDVKKSD